MAAQSLTGRLHIVTVMPLSQGEIAGHHETFLQDLLDNPGSATLAPTNDATTAREDYVSRVLAGGFPLALARTSTAARGRWFDDYVDLVLRRDVLDIASVRQRDQLELLLTRLGGQTAQVLNIANLARQLNMDQSTAENYVGLLEAVFLITRLPAWGTTLRSRAASRPKVHMVDSGIAARLARLTASRLTRLEPAALTEFGHLLRSFAVSELLK